MRKILLIQSRTDLEALARERRNFAQSIGSHGMLECLSALDGHLMWTQPDEFLKYYDGILFGGSSDFDLHGGRDEHDLARVMAKEILTRMRTIVQYALEEKKPLFGVCFGHQLIAEMHGGKVRKDESQGKRGAHQVVLTESGKRDAVFGDISVSFRAHYVHNDAVTMLPKGATLLASGPLCRFSALRYGEKAYTVQFHPEIQCACLEGSQDASRTIQRWLDKVVEAR